MTPASATAQRAVLLLIVVATAVRLLLAAIVDLGLDEAYAVAVSRQFQLSWYDHPPMVFWIVGGLQAVFGPDAPDIVLRLPFIAFSAGSTWLLFRLTEQHFGSVAGLWAVGLFTAAPFFFLSAGSWLVPDGPLVFFLVLAALSISRIILDEEPHAHWGSWLVAGAAVGLALLSKYHAALVVVGMALCFLLSPRLRHWLRRPQPYAAAALAVLMFTPVIVWNAQNEWVSFAFQLGRGGVPASADLAQVMRTFAIEALYLLPTTALLALAAAVWSWRTGGTYRRSASFFLALAMPVIVVVAAVRTGAGTGLPHWAMPGWLFLMPLAGGMLASLGQRLPAVTRTIAGVTLTLFTVMVGAVILLVSDWRVDGIVPGDMDVFQVEAGSWTGVAAGIQASGLLGDDMILAAGSWRDAARVAEAVRAPVPMLALEFDPHGFAWVDQRALLGRDALLVLRQWDTAGLMPAYAPYFESLKIVGTYPTQPGNPHMVDVVLARGFRQPFPWPYGPN